MSKKLFHFDAPIYANYELWGGCNQKCLFCYNSIQKEYEKIPPKDLVINILKTLRDNDIFQVNLLGGEPTLLPYFKEILIFGSELGLFLGFATNGSNIDRDLCEILKKYEISLGISIHGETAEKHDFIVRKEGAFFKAQYALDLLEEFDIPHSVNFVLTKKNLFDFKKLYIDTVEKYKTVKVFYLNRFVPAGKSKDMKELEINGNDLDMVADVMRELEEEYGIELYFGDTVPLCLLKEENRKFSKPCTVGTDFIVIDPLGNVKLCVNTQHTIGNILDCNLIEIWNGKEMDEYRKLDWLNDKCKNCSLLKDCISGCHYSNPNNNSYKYDVDYLIQS